MSMELEDLEVFRRAEAVADGVWHVVLQWDHFARNTVGQQLVRAADSIGANIAESFGRFHYGEKLQFLYFARGSLFETKYWLNRAQRRNLLTTEQATSFANELPHIARQLNAFARTLKRKRSGNTISETRTHYQTEPRPTLISDADLARLNDL